MNDFDWKKLSNVALHLKVYSQEEEFQRSAVGRFYYSCFGLSREYFESTHHIFISSLDSHIELIDYLENSVYDEENEIGENLRKLRKIRNFADYNNVFFIKNVDVSEDLSEDIISSIESLKLNPVVPKFSK